ncbi:hypothetical protein FH972_025456 [Carpinus fangiana]|uniref:60S ribosomal protein L35 n=1 Tax=Carpinus fangiana TaxID=176857 RepID=A0A5N6L3N4_9ROSI|nr:hypothetical protein FH972_025456 [Carpinus fangiana]
MRARSARCCDRVSRWRARWEDFKAEGGWSESWRRVREERSVSRYKIVSHGVKSLGRDFRVMLQVDWWCKKGHRKETGMWDWAAFQGRSCNTQQPVAHVKYACLASGSLPYGEAPRVHPDHQPCAERSESPMPRRTHPPFSCQPRTLCTGFLSTTCALTTRQSSGKVKSNALWGKSKDELRKQLDELKTELGQIRTQKVSGGASSKLTKIVLTVNPYSHDLRKSIARTLTIINQTQRQQLRLFYKNKKYAPLDLRPKQTRAIRRRLSKHEATLVTEKQKKKQTHFPQRNFAVRARRG